VPVRIKGQVSAPKYSIDLTAALKENAGAKLEDKKQELQQKLEQKAGDAISKGLKKLF
jgi:AsmA protein